VKLTASMNCTSGNDPTFAALFVGNKRITINLNGFTISSDGIVTYGIDNAGDWGGNAPGSGGTSGPGTGFNHDTVENGSVSSFMIDGIFVDHTSAMKVSNMKSYSNGNNGLELDNSINASVTRSHFGYKNHGNPSTGLLMGGNTNATISNSSANYNGNGIFDGFPSSQATLNRVEANHNNGDGVQIHAPISPYLIENSKANGNANNGFDVLTNAFNTIKFTGNNAENNAEWGFFAGVLAKGTNNGYKNDVSGGCHKVGGCHLNP
jgi:hypothetical protein